MSQARFRIERTDLYCFAFICDVCGKSTVAMKYDTGKAVAWSSGRGWREESLEEGTYFPLEGWLSLSLAADQQDPLAQHTDMLVCSRQCAHLWIDKRYTDFANRA